MATKVIKEKAIEEALWESANKLRGSVEPSEYKHVVLSLIFLKYAHDRFTERRNELVAEGKEAFADNPVFYNAKNVFYLEPESRWDFLIENAKQNDIAIKIDKTLAKVEQSNPTLKGALPSKYIEFRNRDDQIDFDTKMKQLQADMRDLLLQEEESKQQLKDLFEKLGYTL